MKSSKQEWHGGTESTRQKTRPSNNSKPKHEKQNEDSGKRKIQFRHGNTGELPAYRQHNSAAGAPVIFLGAIAAERRFWVWLDS